jgi:hypothetical protein
MPYIVPCAIIDIRKAARAEREAAKGGRPEPAVVPHETGQLSERLRKAYTETRESGRFVPRNEDWDVITATADGGVIWKRYSDGALVVTRAGETPHAASEPD